MSLRFSREQILEGLILDIADTMAVDAEEIRPNDSFFEVVDESLELLDLSFRLQKRFGIRTRFRELFEGWEIDPQGRPTTDTVQKLSAEFPDIDWCTRITALPGHDPRELLTVDLIAEVISYWQTPAAEVSPA